ncbi:MAG: SMP-30/gluconolactonase/LRE family protein [Planctomycetaceae bacterium]
MFSQMRLYQALLLTSILVAGVSSASSVAQDDTYPVPPDAMVQDGVPQGRIEGPFKFYSKIFPGTVRDYWVYVPAQYDASKPPALFVIQDGIGPAKNWKIPTILDNLISKGEVPVQLGVFVGHGQVPAPNKNAQPRFNRSFEYDGLGDRYARFLIEELLPEVRQKWTFSDNPDDRCIAGSSSGAICAFNVAWERPDQFRRVISTVGTFVALRGADAFPDLVRKTEAKPIRVFLQDGSNDLDIYAGSWWVANQDMLSALRFSGYDVHHIWGEGGHNGKHSASIMPDAIKWIWRDYPQPLKARAGGGKQRRTDLLIEGEEWQLVSEGHKFTEGPAVNEAGELFFTDIPASRIHKVTLDGTVSIFAEETGRANGLMFGADGHLYACRADDSQVVRYSPDGKQMEVVVQGIKCNDLVVFADGSGFVTEPNAKKVWHFKADGTKQEVDSGIEFPNGLITSPDQTLLNVSDTRGRFVYSFQIQADGTLAWKQKYGWLHVTDDLKSEADGMTVDTEGRIYVTTAMGLQVLDQLGRVHFIFNKPKPGWLSNAVFAGPDRDVLVVTCGDSVFKRRIKARGVDTWKAPVTPPKPGL